MSGIPIEFSDPPKKPFVRTPAIATDATEQFTIPNLSGDFSRGKVLATPTNPLDPVNKAYVDSAISAAVSNETICDAVGAMVSGNTETDITVTYQDSDNTLDFAVSDSFLRNDGNDTTSGKVTAEGFELTGDRSSADTAYVPMVLYNTDDTPPAASGFPIGTIYIKYTA